MNNPIKSLFQKLHDSNPKLGQGVSLAVASTTITANSVIFCLPLYCVGIGEKITNHKALDHLGTKIAEKWIGINNGLIETILPEKDWRINLPEDVSPDKKYLLICNHQSWIDTSVIQYVSHYPKNQLPFTRFFTKFELIYIPFLGLAFYFLDFPMMKRHSKEQIAKNPALKGKDIEEANRACNLIRNKPFTLLNYIEGTRYNKSKHDYQKSPFKHLLKPKAGGLSLAISSLGDEIDGILDMTVVYPDYPDEPPSYDKLWRGEIKRLGVDIRPLAMPEELFAKIKAGGYSKDEQAKAEMFAWIDEVWQEKDKRIEKMLSEFE